MQNLLKTQISMEDVLSLFTDKQPKKDIYLTEAYRLFITQKKLKNRFGTVKFYQNQLPKMIDYFIAKGVHTIRSITREILDDYVLHCKANKNKNVTINKHITSMMAVVHYMEECNIIDPLNIKYKKLPEEMPKIEIVPIEDTKRILEYISTISVRSQLMMLLLISTGIRTNELCHIERDNIDLDNLKIYLTFTKTNVPRYCPLLPYVADVIRKYLSEDPTKAKYLFYETGKPNEPTPPSAVRSVIARCKKALNLEVLSAHKLRHLYATTLFKQGTDIKSVSKLLGHSSIRMTERYLDLTQDEIFEKGRINNPLTIAGF